MSILGRLCKDAERVSPVSVLPLDGDQTQSSNSSLISSDTDAMSEKPEAMIKFSNLILSLKEGWLDIYTLFSPDLYLVRYLQLLETVFTGVPFPRDVLFTDPLSSELDVLSHIPEPWLSSLRQWTKQRLSMTLYTLVIEWSFIHFLDPQCPRARHFLKISDVTIFAALTLSLHIDPPSLVARLPLMWDRHLYYQDKGVDTIPFMIWMVNQASQSSVHAGVKSWVHILLPLLLVDNSHKTHQWTDLILDIVEKILAKPGTMKELVRSPYWEHYFVIPCTSLETMMRVRFPPTGEEDTTRRFVEIYHSLKEVALAERWDDPHQQQLFTESLRLAGEENPGLAREALAIAIWYLRTNKEHCGFQYWHSHLEKEVKASLDLLRTLVGEEYHHSPKPPPKDIFIQQLFIVSLKLAGQKGDPVVAKEAATIALRFLTENDAVCWKCWRYVSQKDPHASVFLLQTLVHEWTNDYSLKRQLSTDAMKKFIQQFFMVSLTLLAGEGIHVDVAKDASKIAVWCLMENVDCWRHWDNLYNKRNIKVGVALLNTLVREWKDLSLKLPSSPRDILILRHTMKSFRLKNKKAITERREKGDIVIPRHTMTTFRLKNKKAKRGVNGDIVIPRHTMKTFRPKNKKAITERGEEASLFKEADKHCKVISGKLSSHQGTCTITAAVLLTAPTTAALVLFCLSVFGYLK